MKTPSDTFCVLPWMHLATSAGGELRVCCNSTPNQNFINKATQFKSKRKETDLFIGFFGYEVLNDLIGIKIKK